MYKGTAPVHFIFAGTTKKSEMLYILQLNVGGAIHFITVAKSKMYCMRVKVWLQDSLSTPKAILFTFCNCNKMYSTYNIYVLKNTKEN